MPHVPETRASLILRLPSAADAVAWREFVSIYEPFVYRFARRGGLQDADARELVQNVMLAVARAVGRWRPDSNRGKFRTWLFRIARNQLVDVLRKLRKQTNARGGTTMIGMLEQYSTGEGRVENDLLMSHRRELFRWAADRVRPDVALSTWEAFWLTSVDDRPVAEVAGTLGLSIGAVYIARSRVLARLRSVVRDWEGDDVL